MSKEQKSRPVKMVVTDFVHGGYVAEGTSYIKYCMRCKACGHETGFLEAPRGKEPNVTCDHQFADSSELV